MESNNQELDVDAAVEAALEEAKAKVSSTVKEPQPQPKKNRKNAIAKSGKQATEEALLARVEQFAEGSKQAKKAYLQKGRSDGHKMAEIYATGQQIGLLEAMTAVKIQTAVDFCEQSSLVDELNDEQSGDDFEQTLAEVEAQETDPFGKLDSLVSEMRLPKMGLKRLNLL